MMKEAGSTEVDGDGDTLTQESLSLCSSQCQQGQRGQTHCKTERESGTASDY